MTIALRENFNYRKDRDTDGGNYARLMRELNPVRVRCTRVCTGGVLAGLDIPVSLGFVDKAHAEHWVKCVSTLKFNGYHYTDFAIEAND